MDEDEIREMDMREFRDEYSDGLVSLFSQPDVRFLLDALMEHSPDSTFTQDRLQNRSGISGEAFSAAFETLVDVGVVVSADDDGEYTVWADNPVYRLLIELNSAVHRMRSDDGQAVRDARDNLPPTRYTYSCPECGNDREYEGRLPHGSVYSCRACSHEWVFPSHDTPERVEEFYESTGLSYPNEEVET